ncbi:MAG: hypothetical protein MZU79_02550 [Anaerotruncus sp.]|nr:hypothetical protein [Anaerotruncus sp.]
MLDSIILQAAVIDGFNADLLTENEIGQINQFHLLIEEVMTIIQFGPKRSVQGPF